MARNAPQKTPPRTDADGAVSENENPHASSEPLDELPAMGEGADAREAPPGRIRGGAAGFVPNASRTIHPSPEEIIERAKEQASPFASDKAGAEPRRFRAVNERRVMYAGSLSVVKAGKVYAEHECDLGLLERQGVVFEQISGPPREQPQE